MRPYALYADGASRGNPGPAGIGVLLCDPDGSTVTEISQHIGVTTNNVAEYEALLRGLDEALSRGVTHLVVYLDSELLVKQLCGQYKVRAPHLAELHQRAKRLIQRFGQVEIQHLPRRANHRADRLASEAALNQDK
ncbi:MAG: ribonuclease HI family protein [Armatimonadota bacterium]